MKKTIFALPVAALVAVGVVACTDAPGLLAPEGPNRELVDESLRIDHDDATHFVYAFFAYEPDGGVGTVLTGGEPGNPPPGIVPGNQKHLGTCHDGKWHNPAGRPTTGTAANPHPFCYVPAADGYTVVLERIAAVYEEKVDKDSNITHRFLYFTNELDEDEYSVKFLTTNGNMRASGEIEARAVKDDPDVGDLVGHIKFDLDQFNLGQNQSNLFSCSFASEDPKQDGCLAKNIAISYQPITGWDGDDPILGDAVTIGPSDSDDDYDVNQNVFLFWVKKGDVLNP
jgi:hypothetical protein